MQAEPGNNEQNILCYTLDGKNATTTQTTQGCPLRLS